MEIISSVSSHLPFITQDPHPNSTSPVHRSLLAEVAQRVWDQKSQSQVLSNRQTQVILRIFTMGWVRYMWSFLDEDWRSHSSRPTQSQVHQWQLARSIGGDTVLDCRYCVSLSYIWFAYFLFRLQVSNFGNYVLHHSAWYNVLVARELSYGVGSLPPLCRPDPYFGEVGFPARRTCILVQPLSWILSWRSSYLSTYI